MRQPQHIPVLLDRVLEIFAPALDSSRQPESSAIFIDCTLGLGGHSAKILESYPHVQLIGIDQDEQAITIARETLSRIAPKLAPIIIHDNFANGFNEALDYARSSGGRVAGILADIGVSSLQLDDLSRGFGFQSDRLDMRMDSRISRSASDIIASYGEFALGEILREYGEVGEYKKMARLMKEFAMKSRRDESGFYSAKELSDVLSKHFRSARGKIHPATLAFQALRIEVNSELSVLKHLLESIARAADSHSNEHDKDKSAQDLQNTLGTIIGIISFHSLEDRIVKETFKSWARSCICDEHVLRCECGGNHARGKILTKKPLTASNDELRANPRARSAKLRAFALHTRI